MEGSVLSASFSLTYVVIQVIVKANMFWQRVQKHHQDGISGKDGRE